MRRLAPLPLLIISLTLSLAAAQPAKEFQNSHGILRVTLAAEVTAHADSAASVSTPALPALPDLGVHGDALLEVYFLDRDDGQELRFPVRYTQLVAFAQGHAEADSTASGDDRAVAFMRDFSRELRIRMKTPGLDGGKQ